MVVLFKPSYLKKEKKNREMFYSSITGFLNMCPGRESQSSRTPSLRHLPALTELAAPSSAFLIRPREKSTNALRVQAGFSGIKTEVTASRKSQACTEKEVGRGKEETRGRDGSSNSNCGHHHHSGNSPEQQEEASQSFPQQ